MCAGVSFLDVRGDISERKAEAVKKTRLWQYNGTGGEKNFLNKIFFPVPL